MEELVGPVEWGLWSTCVSSLSYTYFQEWGRALLLPPCHNRDSISQYFGFGFSLMTSTARVNHDQAVILLL